MAIIRISMRASGTALQRFMSILGIHISLTYIPLKGNVHFQPWQLDNIMTTQSTAKAD